MFAGLAIFCDFLLQITCFVAVLALDAKRQVCTGEKFLLKMAGTELLFLFPSLVISLLCLFVLLATCSTHRQTLVIHLQDN